MPRPLLDRVRERDRRSARRNEREDAARRHSLEPHQAAGDRIQAAKIVQQPAVDARIGERALDVGERRSVSIASLEMSN